MSIWTKGMRLFSTMIKNNHLSLSVAEMLPSFSFGGQKSSSVPGTWHLFWITIQVLILTGIRVKVNLSTEEDPKPQQLRYVAAFASEWEPSSVGCRDTLIMQSPFSKESNYAAP